jgi:hypothetical protein
MIRAAFQSRITMIGQNILFVEPAMLPYPAWYPDLIGQWTGQARTRPGSLPVVGVATWS